MMQDGPWTKYAAPQPAPQEPVQAPWERYQVPAAAPARQPSPQRQPAPARPAPGAPLNSLGITDEEELANLTAQYGSREDAIRYQQERMAADANFDPGMAPAQPALPQADAVDEWFMRRDATRSAGLQPQPIAGTSNEDVQSQAEMAQQWALERYQRRGEGSPLAAINSPWLMREPRFAQGEAGGVDPETGETIVNRAGVLDRGNGRFEIYDPTSDAYYPATQADVDAYQGQLSGERKVRMDRRAREADPKYQAEYAAARQASENVPAWMANASTGQTLGGLTYAVGASNFLDPMTDGIDRGLASQAGRDAFRDYLDSLMAKDPLGSVGMQMAGGLLTPGVKGSSDWIAGATGAQRAGRAAAVGSGYGFVSGALNTEGGLAEKGQGGLLGAAVGGPTAGLLDLGVQRGASLAASGSAGRVSASRRLSRQGVQLTPGQMLQDTPVVGGMIRGFEDGVSGIPFMGSAVQGARNEGIDSLNRVAVNRALAPVGESLPKTVATGYDAIRYVQQTLGAKYDALLPRITAVIDPTFNTEINDILARADVELPADLSARLRAIVGGDRILARASVGGQYTGDEFKAVENTLRLLTERYSRSQDVDQQAIADMLVDTRSAFSEMLARSNPAEAVELRAINTGWANLSRVQRAAGGTAALGREGQFTPGELGVSVLQGATQGARGRGDVLMQDLARDAKAALPNTIGDTGTATRGAVTGLIAGSAAGLVSPVMAIPAVGAALAYSKPAQVALNFIYRATDRVTAGPALAELQSLARRNPALQPYYLEAARHVQALLAGPEQGQTPAATGLLSPTSP